MRILKLAFYGFAAYGVVSLVQRIRTRAELHGGIGSSYADPSVMIIEEVEVVPVDVGIADVDPEGLTQFGEGIDPEATQAAHSDVRDQRERMPYPGKNIP